MITPRESSAACGHCDEPSGDSCEGCPSGGAPLTSDKQALSEASPPGLLAKVVAVVGAGVVAVAMARGMAQAEAELAAEADTDPNGIDPAENAPGTRLFVPPYRPSAGGHLRYDVMVQLTKEQAEQAYLEGWTVNAKDYTLTVGVFRFQQHEGDVMGLLESDLLHVLLMRLQDLPISPARDCAIIYLKGATKALQDLSDERREG